MGCGLAPLAFPAFDGYAVVGNNPAIGENTGHARHAILGLSSHFLRSLEMHVPVSYTHLTLPTMLWV